MAEETACGEARRPDPHQEPPTAHESQRGVFRAAFGVLRRNWRALYGRTARATVLAALGGLSVTGAGFLAAWPAFSEMRRGALAARRAGDSYAPDGRLVNGLLLIALAGLPLLIVLLHLGGAAVQTVAARAAAGRAAAGPERELPPPGGRLGGPPRARFRSVFAAFVLRGVCAWSPLVLGFLVEESFTTTTFREYTALVPKWQYPHLFFALRYGSTSLGLAAVLLLRLGWAVAPAAAADGLPAAAALRRSWSLVWSRAGRLRTAAVAVPLWALSAGTYALLQLAAAPLHSGAVSLFLEWGPDNTYAAYTAGLLAPVAAASLLTGALTLPSAHIALAVLHRRLAADRERAAQPPRTATAGR